MKNRTGRKLLEKRYGKGCFMERAGIREITPGQEVQLRKITGCKKLNRNISYHHIKPRSEGGKVTIENGANLAIYNHEWLNQQPKEVVDDVNNKLRKFKRDIDIARLSIGDKSIDFDSLGSFKLEYDFDDCIVIPAYTMTKDEWKEKKKFNRAKQKRENMKLIDEELYR